MSRSAEHLFLREPRARRAIRARGLALTFTTALAATTYLGSASARDARLQDHDQAPATERAAHGETGGGQSGEDRGEPAVHEGAHEGGHHGVEALNWTDIWDKRRPAILALVINFGVLMTLYYMLGKKPITDALKQRRVAIGKEIDEAQKLLDEAKERATKYQAGLNNADVDAATAKSALIASGKGEIERLLREAQEKAERMRRDAIQLVEQERKQLHQDLRRETVEAAVEEAARILEKSATAEDHGRLARDLLGELSVRTAARAASSSAPLRGEVS